MRVEDHEVLVTLLTQELLSLRQPLHGHQPVTHEQLRRAAVEAWRVASVMLDKGLHPDETGTLPAGVALRKAAEDSRVIRLLSPIQMSSNKRSEGSGSCQVMNASKKAKRRNLPQSPSRRSRVSSCQLGCKVLSICRTVQQYASHITSNRVARSRAKDARRGGTFVPSAMEYIRTWIAHQSIAGLGSSLVTGSRPTVCDAAGRTAVQDND
eukprot:4828793-Amphidinium_carterae.1